MTIFESAKEADVFNNLTSKIGDDIVIGDIRLSVVNTHGGYVDVAVESPDDVTVCQAKDCGQAVIPFKHFSREQDAEIETTLLNNSIDTDIISSAKRIGASQSRDPIVIIQRGFQLGLIAYSPFAHCLLSHRKNGWRSDEINFLIAHCSWSKQALSKTLNRSIQSIAKQMHEFKLTCGGSGYIWREDEKAQLQSHHEKTLRDLQAMLDRSAIDIKHQMIELDLAKIGVFRQFTGRPKSVN